MKQVGSKTKDLVFGYFRENHKILFSQNDNPYYSIQPLIIYCCVSFYFVHDDFSGYQHPCITVSNKNKTVTCNDGTNYTAYGSKIIDSYDNKSTCIWRIKVDHIAAAWYDVPYDVAVGIQASHQDQDFSSTNWYHSGMIGCAYVSRGTLWKDGKRVGKDGDFKTVPKYDDWAILTVCANMKAKYVRFLLNEKEVAKLDDIEQRKDLKYKLAVNMTGIGTECTLIDFHEIFSD